MKKNIMEAMEYMDQKYIDEALEASCKKNTRQPIILRWAAIAACLVLVVSLSIGYFGGLSAPQPVDPAQDGIVLPPVRYGAGSMNISLARKLTIEEAFEEAEVVAWVRIGNWLGEDFDPIGRTFYKAQVIQCLKGDVTGEFVLCQLGSSKGTFQYSPLYTNGNEFLVFLKMLPSGMNTDEYKNAYQSIGMFSTVLDIVRDNQNNVYVSDGFGMFGESIVKKENAPKNFSDNKELKQELCGKALTIDEIQSKKVESSEYVFSFDAIKEYLK